MQIFGLLGTDNRLTAVEGNCVSLGSGCELQVPLFESSHLFVDKVHLALIQ